MNFTVAFRMDFWLEDRPFAAEMECVLPFIPVAGMHLGPSQMLTVCQVHWLGSNRLQADIRSMDFGVEYRGRIRSVLNAGCADTDAPELFNWMITKVEE